MKFCSQLSGFIKIEAYLVWWYNGAMVDGVQRLSPSTKTSVRVSSRGGHPPLLTELCISFHLKCQGKQGRIGWIGFSKSVRDSELLEIKKHFNSFFGGEGQITVQDFFEAFLHRWEKPELVSFIYKISETTELIQATGSTFPSIPLTHEVEKPVRRINKD